MSVVLLDCDGVLADFVGHLIDRLHAQGHEVPRDVTDYDFLRGFGEATGKASRALLKDAGHWRSIPPYEGAAGFVDEIRACGHEVVIVTSPWLSCEAWAHARREWLAEHFDVEARDLIVTSRKELVRGDVFIDDHATTVTAWAEKNPRGHALLMNRSYTVADPWPRRFSWDRLTVGSLMVALESA